MHRNIKKETSTTHSILSPFLSSMRCRSILKLLLIAASCCLLLWLCLPKYANCPTQRFHTTDNGSKSTAPFIFIGGYPRSGTTLMRVLLDVHPKVRCGPETRILPRFFRVVDIVTPFEKKRLLDASISEAAVDASAVSFLHEFVARIGHDAERLCVKDPFIDYHIPFITRIFPNSKFVLMVRDGRAVANSVVARNVTIRNVDWSNPEEVLRSWNRHCGKVSERCDAAGPDRCMTVKYELLVLRPRETMSKVLKFLNLPWDDAVLAHEKDVDRVSLAKNEKSTSQVVWPIYTVGLNSWAKEGSKISADVISRTKSLTMLIKYGYAKLSIPPVYGVAENSVVKNTQELTKNSNFKNLFPSLT